jgi:LuxR family maltose regulon positive regulatory protein
MVDAPPGFGKSVLLEQLSVSWRHTGTRTAWLTMDASDDPESVIRYLAFSFHVAGLELSRTALLEVGTLQPPKRALQLQALIGAIEESRHEWLLVVDDLERASVEIIREVFEPLARFLPHTLTLAFGTRGPVSIDLRGLSDRGLVFRLGPEQLQLKRAEIRAVLGSRASAAEARMIERRTGGWPALVQFLRDEGVATGQGSSVGSLERAPIVGEFFEEHIVRSLDGAPADLLMKLSLLPFFSVELLSELFGADLISGDMRLLERLGVIYRVSNAFGMPSAIRPIFQDYFAKKLVRENGAEAAEVRRRAARAFVSRGAYVDAVKLAVLTGDSDFVADTVEAIEPLLQWAKYGVRRLTQILCLVPESVIRRRPHVGYAQVMRLVKAGRPKDAQELFDALEPLVEWNGLRNSTPGSPLLCGRALCGPTLRITRCIPVSREMIEELDSVAEATVAFRTALTVMSASLRCYELQHAGSFEAARQLAHECLERAVNVDSKYVAFFIYCDLALISGVKGKVGEAFAFFDQCDRYCQAVVRDDDRLSLIRDALRLELQHEIDPLDMKDVLRLKNICVRVPRLEGWLDVFAAAFRTYSEKLFFANDCSAALASLSVGIDLFRSQDIDGAANILLAQRVLLLALAGYVQQGLTEFAELERALAADPYRTSRSWREVEAFLEARVAIDLIRGTREASSDVDKQIAVAQSSGNVRSELRLRHLRGVWNGPAWRSEDSARIGYLETQHAFTRSAALMRAGAGRARQQHEPSDAASHLEFFTEREIQILDKISDGLSDKQIAGKLGITPHGVRYHLKRIYAKLNVTGRAEAPTRAIELGMFRPTATAAH